MLFMEVCGPISMFTLFIYLKNLMPENTREIIYDKNPLRYNEIVSEHYIGSANIAYTPHNNLTEVIMSDVSNKLAENNITGQF